MDPATLGGIFLSAFLQVLFDRIAPREVWDWFRARKLDGPLGKLQITLLAVDKVLDDAENKQITDPRVKQWLDALHEAVYDAEDLLDAVNTEAMQRTQEKESSSHSKTSKSKLKLKKLRNIFSSSAPSDREMEAKLKQILEKLEDIVKQKDVLDLKEGICEKPSQKRLPTTSLMEEPVVYGRDEDKEVILKLLMSDNTTVDGLDVVTIKGMGGIGKTTLAQLVYNDPVLQAHFDFKAWVCISEEFDVFKVTRTLLEAVSSSTSVTSNPDLLQVELKKNLMNKKFLLVLDDVWNENRSHWETLKKPLQHGAKGSKILVTTRNEGVARIMRTVPTHYLKQLSDEDCWLLFAKHAFANGEAGVHPTLKAVGREILKKCEGLPLAAKALGGVLRYKTTPGEWINVLESNIWDLRDEDSNILPVLRVSYHYLPSNLKRCFTYSSIFPKDYEFEKEQLILLWKAQSLLVYPERGEKLEEVGYEYFDELASRSFFERSSVNKSRFVMHDLINDLARFVSGQSCLCMDLENTQQVSKITRHLSYFRMRLKRFETLPTTNCLRTFLQLQKRQKNDFGRPVYLYHEEVSDNLLQKFKLLRALSLCEYEIYDLPDTIDNLKHLRYLDLSMTSIKRLPDSICNLYNLQTLLLVNCWGLTELPINMWKLANLQYLDFSGCYQVKEMPRNMGKLKCLQTLSTFIVGKHSGMIGELGQLSDLRGKLSILKLQNVALPEDAHEARLKEKKYLVNLNLEWSDNDNDSEMEYDVLEKLQPHKNLQELTINSYGHARFPKWVGDQLYLYIASVKLENCKYCLSLPSLGQLPSLKNLSIAGLHGLLKVEKGFYGNISTATPFISLQILSFKNMSEWQEWSNCAVEAFPALQELCIENCPKLTGCLPSCLPLLTRLTIEECPQLATSLPRSPALVDLRLVSSNELLLNELPRGLQSLSIHRYESLESLPETMMLTNTCLENLDLFRCPSLVLLSRNGLPSALRSLTMYGCQKLELLIDQQYASLEYLSIETSCDTLRCFPFKWFPKLNYLHFSMCDNLESISLSDGPLQEHVSLTRLDICNCPKFLAFPDKGLPFPNLQYLSVQNNEKVKHLPKQMHALRFLQNLIVHNCPEIESLPEGGLPSSLTLLWISYCEKIAAELLTWGLRGLTSLRDLKISGECEGVKSFPKEGLLSTALSILEINGFSDLETLEYKGLQHLTSLTELTIWSCPKLQSIPKEGLPTSLTSIRIGSCPLLEPRLQREQGEDWDKIARIPRIRINGKLVVS